MKPDGLPEGVSELLDLIERMLETPPLRPDEVAEKLRGREKVSYVDGFPKWKMIEENKPKVRERLQRLKVPTRTFNYDLRWQVEVMSEQFDDWLRVAEWPSYHPAAYRIGVILRKAKARDLDAAFAEAYGSHFNEAVNEVVHQTLREGYAEKSHLMDAAINAALKRR